MPHKKKKDLAIYLTRRQVPYTEPIANNEFLEFTSATSATFFLKLTYSV